MKQQEIIELLDYFTRYSSSKEYVHYFHKEWDSFKIGIYNQTEEVFQLNTDHEPFGIELNTLEDLKTRFKSFTGERLEDIPGVDSEMKQKISMLENQVELLEEDIECVHMWLDNQGAPQYDFGERMNKYSIVGRIQELIKTITQVKQS